MRNRTAIFAALSAGALLPAHAQWLSHPDPRTPRAKDGKPNLTAAAPRLDGKPDLSGLWQADRGLKPEAEPLSAEGAAAYKSHQATPFQYPHTQCLPDGIPADMFVMTFKVRSGKLAGGRACPTTSYSRR